MLENNFMIRYSTLDFQRGADIVNTTESSEINEILAQNKGDFDNILLSVSPNIILEHGNNAKISATKLKYMDRAATRTTPLGLLAGVMEGKFNKTEDYSLNFKQNNLHITVDREWLDKVICKVKERSLNDNISLNPSIYIYKDKIINTWITSDKTSKEHDIKITPPVREVIKVLTHKKEIMRYELINFLTKKFGQTKDVIINFLNQLIKENIILSDISNLILFKEPLKYLIKTLALYKDNQFDNLLNKLKNIELLIVELETKGILKSRYQKVEEIMKKLAISQHYLHIDLYNSGLISFPTTQKNRIEQLEEFLLATSNHPDSLKEFKDAFKDRYSVNTLVNFKDLFNPRTGLANLKVTHEDDEWLRKNLFNSLKVSDERLELEKEKWVRKLENNVNFSSLKNVDLELALMPLIRDGKIIYTISPLVGAVGNGNVEGRFSELNLFSQKDNEYQLIYEPKVKRVANILKSVDSNKTLGYNTFPQKNGISVKDIFILLDTEDEFHLFCEGKEIKTSYFSMVNQEVTPTELSFLSIIGNEKKDEFQIIRLIEQYKEKNFITPEVWYKNFLISGKCWNIEYFVTKDTKDEDIKKFLLKKANKIDKIVYWENGDNRILINLKSTFFINELVKALKKQGYVRFEKCYFTSKNLLLNSKNQKYLGEFVFRFRKNKNFENNFLQGVKKKHNSSLSYKNSFFMSSKWTEFQIYLKSEDMNDFLVTEPFISNGQIPYFYIRYKSMDKGDHIRLRLKISKNFKSEIFNIINELKCQYENQKIRDLSINIYKREIDRYGEQSIEKVERIFCLESKLAIHILKKYHDLSDDLWNIVFYHNILMLLECKDIEDAINIFGKFNNFHDRKVLNKEYRIFQKKKKKTFEFLKNSDFNEIIKILKELKKSEEVDLFTETLLSLQHLFHNRVIGINVISETKMNYFIQKYLKNILYSDRKRFLKKDSV